MKINIEDILEIDRLRKDFNKLNLNSIDFYKDNKKIDIPKHIIEEFDYYGLSNIDFVTGRYWEKKETW